MRIIVINHQFGYTWRCISSNTSKRGYSRNRCDLPSSFRDHSIQPTPQQCARQREVVLVGLRMAEEAGVMEPTVKDAVWELMLEAADTLKRLPDGERRWLRSGTHSSWPGTLREHGEVFAAAVSQGGHWEPMSPGLSPPSSGAIARFEIVILWLGQITGRTSRLETGVVFGLAAGIPVRVLRRRFGIGRRTVYDVRDRGIRKICSWLETIIAE